MTMSNRNNYNFLIRVIKISYKQFSQSYFTSNFHQFFTRSPRFGMLIKLLIIFYLALKLTSNEGHNAIQSEGAEYIAGVR